MCCNNGNVLVFRGGGVFGVAIGNSVGHEGARVHCVFIYVEFYY